MTAEPTQADPAQPDPAQPDPAQADAAQADPAQPDPDEAPSFPRLSARTARFTAGQPRAATLSPDGARVVFLRSRSGTDRAGLLWEADAASGHERLVADPAVVLAGSAETALSPAERARRERSRESGAGIVGYATDTGHTVAAFALSDRLFVVALGVSGGVDVGSATGTPRELPAAASVIDPRPDPTGAWVAYASGPALRVSAADGSGDRELVGPAAGGAGSTGEADVSWGQAEFTAAEDMDRPRGFWWSPDGAALLVERADDSAVALRYAADPADPRAEPAAVRYPFAGTADSDVTLWLVPRDEPTQRVRIAWDTAALPYLTRVAWPAAHRPLLEVVSRDQRRRVVLEVQPGTGATTVLTDHADDAWLEPVPGVPDRAPDGRLLEVLPDRDSDTYRLMVGGVALSSPGRQVEAVLSVTDEGALVRVSPDSITSQLDLVGWDGTRTPLTDGTAVHTGALAGRTLLLTRADLDTPLPTTTVTVHGGRARTLGSLAVAPPFRPEVRLATVARNRLDTAVLLPRGGGPHAPGSLPVLLDPYGGPGAARVVAASRAYLESQWWADQGFAVVVADGRGTPGRGPASDRSIRHAFAAVTLQDQVDALAAVAADHPEFDLTRVAIRGWSFGGYLAALAVLRRPDVFAAAVAGAPPTDWRLYSTYYTERYLGDPADRPEVYAANGLLTDAATLRRPLMLVHGLADDNVLVAHTLALSDALLAGGRAHTVLPLSGITHMATQETVAENLLLLQRDFLLGALRAPAG